MSIFKRTRDVILGGILGAGTYGTVGNVGHIADPPKTIQTTVIKKWISSVFHFEGHGGVAQWKSIPANIHDRGGLTNSGLTYVTYKALCQEVLDTTPSYEHFYNLKPNTIEKFYYYHFNKIRGNELHIPGVAIILTEIGWGSGLQKPYYRLAQVINNYNYSPKKFRLTYNYKYNEISELIDVANQIGEPLIKDLTDWRIKVVDWDIQNNPEQKVYEKGWKKRIYYARDFCYNNDLQFDIAYNPQEFSN